MLIGCSTHLGGLTMTALAQPMEQPPESTWTVVLENIGLVHKAVKIYCRKPQDYDDLVQEGLIGMHEAARRFDPNHASGASFGSFVYTYIKGYILNYYYVKPEHLDTDQLTPEQEDGILTEGEEEYIRTCLRSDLIRHLRKLDENERVVIALRWLAPQTLTLRELGKRLGMVGERVRQIEAKAFAKLRALMEVK